MQNLIMLAKTLLDDTDAALKAVKKKRYGQAKELLDTLVQLSEEEIRVLLANVQIGEGSMYLFDVKQKASEIKREAELAKRLFQEGQQKSVIKLLHSIKSIEKEVIGEEKSYSDEIVLVSKIAAEVALILFIRNQVDPYVQALGRELDILNYKLNHLDEFLNTKVKSVMDKLKFWEEKTEQQKDDMVISNEELYEKYQGLTEHPRWIPHISRDEPYAYIFSDLAHLILLGALAYAIGTRNIPMYIRKKLEKRRIIKVYQILNARYEKQIEVLRTQTLFQHEQIGALEERRSILEQEISKLPDIVTEQVLARITKEISALRQEELNVIKQTRQGVEDAAKSISGDARALASQLAAK